MMRIFLVLALFVAISFARGCGHLASEPDCKTVKRCKWVVKKNGNEVCRPRRRKNKGRGKGRILQELESWCADESNCASEECEGSRDYCGERRSLAEAEVEGREDKAERDDTRRALESFCSEIGKKKECKRTRGCRWKRGTGCMEKGRTNAGRRELCKGRDCNPVLESNDEEEPDFEEEGRRSLSFCTELKNKNKCRAERACRWRGRKKDCVGSR